MKHAKSNRINFFYYEGHMWSLTYTVYIKKLLAKMLRLPEWLIGLVAPWSRLLFGILTLSLGPGCSEFFLKVKTVYNGLLRNPQIVFFVALYTLDIFANNIAIKRYWDKKIKWHFSSNIFFPVGIKNNFLGQF
jgi:hypothetical protein